MTIMPMVTGLTVRPGLPTTALSDSKFLATTNNGFSMGTVQLGAKFPSQSTYVATIVLHASTAPLPASVRIGGLDLVDTGAAGSGKTSVSIWRLDQTSRATLSTSSSLAVNFSSVITANVWTYVMNAYFTNRDNLVISNNGANLAGSGAGTVGNIGNFLYYSPAIAIGIAACATDQTGFWGTFSSVASGHALGIGFNIGALQFNSTSRLNGSAYGESFTWNGTVDNRNAVQCVYI